MTTTVKALGGGAQPASIDTSGKTTGGPALRVYGFDSEADALAAGYVCEGGPAMSVALITDAQIASGDWKAEGDPAALVIYTAPSNMPIEGGYSVPVYPVNGWGSAPVPSDPIGDALRAATFAHWTLDEAAGNARIDSKDSHDLSEYLTVPSATGKIGNAAKFVDDLNDAPTLQIASLAINFPNGFAITCWVWFPQFIPADDGQIAIVQFFGDSSTPIGLYTGIFVTGQPEMGVYDLSGSVVSGSLQVGQWHFVASWVDADLATSHLQIDNGSVITNAGGGRNTNQSGLLMIGNPSYVNAVDYLLVDELTLYDQPITTDDTNYLWNSGAGRALFP